MSSKKECPVDHNKLKNSIPTKGGGCPVDHSQFQKKPSDHNKKPSIPTKGGGCPVDHSQFQKKPTSNNNNKKYVKGLSEPSISDDEELDPRNLMPKNPKQRPSADQPFELPTYRMVSSIPKTDKDGNDKWVYPSQQMYYNAMKRKGGAIAQEKEELEEAMRLHNVTNEFAWKKILEWEHNLHSECDEISLTSLRGRYNDVSLKAKIKQLFGWDRPFDRHDWVVNRCGTDVRYILDYYDSHVINKETESTTELDVRPAIDSFQSIIDRSKMFFYYKRKIEAENKKRREQQETDHQRYTRLIQEYAENKNNENIKDN